MNRSGLLLFILLLLQLGIVAMLYQEEITESDHLASNNLLDPGAYIVDKLSLTDESGATLELNRAGERWLLPGLENLPADTTRVEALLQQLTAADPGWSVAHSLAARQRFLVAHYHYRRKLTLSALDRELGTVYLGTSPGFRKVHARNDAADNIYAVALNLFDLPVDPGKWLDPSLLQIRAPMAINADGYTLQRTSGSWQLGSGATPDPRELQALLDALRHIQIQGVAPRATQTALMGTEAQLILQVQALAGTVELQLFKHGDQHFIGSSEYPYLFLISAYDFDKLTGIDSLLIAGEQ
ncbi:DUF4340 domain-containing protein [Pseudohalioglobus lutimaris]|uniref:DUF4340 domain-containing protein n=1 Tax=Pseudohalioglobus lutimaris TaxID=1737061 RepID=A0A2N5X3Z7_9GAMM|nr:DUF4340 domain-containing protein [Pseudohalioglobus lutimaris]PLW69215.1 hypothetical protein C0039_09130 [Pseudohalioglobus lutimaris]